MMANGTDEDGARIARMDGWILWETEEGVAHWTPNWSPFPCSFRAPHTPSPAHSTLTRAEDFLYRSFVVAMAGVMAGFFVCLHIP